MSQQQDETAAELARQQAAQSFEVPEPSFFDDVGESPAFAPLSSFEDEPRRERERDKTRVSGGQIFALEDLYAQYPDIGKGDWKLRISRMEPKSFRGHASAGFICELWDKISLDEFRGRFGGGVYQVLVMKPTSPNEGTLSDFRTVKDVRFRVAGDPIVGSDSGVVQNVSDGNNMNTAVETQRLQIEAKERERLYVERQRAEEKAERIQREMVPSIYETTNRIAEKMQGLSGAQIEFWKQEADTLRGEVHALRQQHSRDLNEKESEIRRLHEDIIGLKEKATTNQFNLESKAVNDLRLQYETRISELKDQTAQQIRELRERLDEDRRRMTDEHTKKLSEMSADHRRITEDLTRRHDDERRNYESSQSLERERIREDARYRIDQITSQKETEVRQLRETFEQRIADLRLSTDRELQSVRDATAREIESIRQSERAQASLAKESAEMRKEAAKAEEQRVRTELAELRRENVDLRDRLDQERAKQHKDPITAIREIREMGAELGLVDASAASEKPEKDESTMSQFLGLARQAFDSAPQVMEKIMEARREQAQAIAQAQAMQAQAAQAQAMQAQQMQLQQQQRAARQLPAPQPQQRQSQRAPQTRYAPPAAPPPAPPVEMRSATPFGSNYAPAPSSPVPFAPPATMVASPVQSATAPAPIEQAPMASESELIQASPMTQEVSTIDSQPSEGMSADTGSMIIKFFEKLDGAVANKVLSPETFAIGVIGEIGAEQTASLLQQFSPQDVIETAQQISPDTSIATRDGQRFVRDLWRIAGDKVRSQGFSA